MTNGKVGAIKYPRFDKRFVIIPMVAVFIAYNWTEEPGRSLVESRTDDNFISEVLKEYGADPSLSGAEDLSITSKSVSDISHVEHVIKNKNYATSVLSQSVDYRAILKRNDPAALEVLSRMEDKQGYVFSGEEEIKQAMGTDHYLSAYRLKKVDPAALEILNRMEDKQGYVFSYEEEVRQAMNTEHYLNAYQLKQDNPVALEVLNRMEDKQGYVFSGEEEIKQAMSTDHFFRSYQLKRMAPHVVEILNRMEDKQGYVFSSVEEMKLAMNTEYFENALRKQEAEHCAKASSAKDRMCVERSINTVNQN